MGVAGAGTLLGLMSYVPARKSSCKQDRSFVGCALLKFGMVLDQIFDGPGEVLDEDPSTSVGRCSCRSCHRSLLLKSDIANAIEIEMCTPVGYDNI